MKTSRLYISFSNIKSVKLFSGKEYSLNTNDIIIYCIYLPDFIDLKSDLYEFLNSIEIKKAKRFYKEIDRNRFITYRAILKIILGAYTKLAVKNIYLDYDFNKKPYLASHPWLHFNISHSENFAIIAISRKKVGIDIEYLSEDFKFTNLLPDIFDEKERLTIQNAADKKKTFYSLWTRKESFVKALGKGIDEDFKYIPSLDGYHNVDFSLIKNTQNWQVYSFEISDYYLGAIAFEGLSPISNNLKMYSIPNTMTDLLKLIPIK
ncbi:4'-phosphopantetheinyl transferase family protein [Flavobacterium saccharophilum]|uniref:4'-phosphopantetheinyl transferase n=1 Tax=Flavobacterium saccharophilum TaxID=29534 RepID=A0A1M7INI5_9FLAO|nr:4'-phosphopantetheinyl transferase superfamily protein [Flavobacterium saccharophilum]SHM41947.1 4'-phosphopantetheinyl transferase [Flavobacterium saccharophilum]